MKRLVNFLVLSLIAFVINAQTLPSAQILLNGSEVGSETTVCNDSIVLSTAIGDQTSIYYWQRTNLSNITSDLSTLSRVSLIQNESKVKYTVFVNYAGTLYSDSLILNVREAPVVLTLPNISSFVGTNVVINATNQNNSDYTYQWYENGVVLNNGGLYQGVTTYQLSFKRDSSLIGRRYECRVTNSGGCFSFARTPLGQGSLYTETLNTSITRSSAACVGDLKTISVTYSGGSNLYDIQLLNTENLVEGQQAIRSNVEAGTQDFVFRVVDGIRNYSFRVFDKNIHYSTILTTSIIGNPKPIVSVIAFTRPTDCVSSNGSITVTQGYSYLWSTGHTTATANNLYSGSYEVVVTNLDCSTTFSYKLDPINVPTGVLRSSSVDNIICEGEEVVFTVTSTAPEVRFLKNGVEVRGWASGTGSNQFRTKQITNNDTISAELHSINGCVGIVSGVIMKVKPKPIPVLVSKMNPTTCNSSDGLITVSGGSSYSWNTVPVRTTAVITNLREGNYICTVVNNGCSDTISVSLLYPLAPTGILGSSDEDNIICDSEEVIFAVNTLASEVRFLKNGIQVRGWASATTSNMYITDNLSNNDIISAEIRTGNCLTVLPGITVKVKPKPIPVLLSKTNPSTCNSSDGSITVSGGSSYSWNTVPVRTTATITNLQQGNYTCTVMNNGCSDTISVSLISPLAPTGILSSSAVDNIICSGEEVVFTVTSTAPEVRFLKNGVEVRGWASATGSSTYITKDLSNDDIVSAEIRNGSCLTVLSGIATSVGQSPIIHLDKQLIILPGDSLTPNIGVDEFSPVNDYVIQNYSCYWTGPDKFVSNDFYPWLSKSGKYTISVQNYYGCASKREMEVILFNPSDTSFIEHTLPRIVCYGGDPLILDSYVTYPHKGKFTGVNVSDRKFNPIEKGIFNVFWTLGDVTRDILVTVVGPPVVHSHMDTILACEESNVWLSAVGIADTYSWFSEDERVLSQNQHYKVLVKDPVSYILQAGFEYEDRFCYSYDTVYVAPVSAKFSSYQYIGDGYFDETYGSTITFIPEYSLGTSYNWNFGNVFVRDGGRSDSISPVYNYRPYYGYFDVTLNMSSVCGDFTHTEKVFVNYLTNETKQTTDVEIFQNNDFKVYCNENILIIESNEKNISKIQIFDLFGKILTANTFGFGNKNSYQVDMSKYRSGIYIATIFDEKGGVFSKRFIK